MQKFLVRSLFLVLLLSAAESWALPPCPGTYNESAWTNCHGTISGHVREKGSVTRGWLGVNFQGVTQELAESFGMGKPHGALVAQVLDHSPAKKAGIETGDVIVKINKELLESSIDLPRLVGTVPVGCCLAA